MVDDRKARLKALASRAGRNKEPANDNDGDNDNDNSGGANANKNTNANTIPPRKPNISFRNYAPTDNSLTALSKQQQQRQQDDSSKNHEESSPTSMGPPASKRPRTRNATPNESELSSRAGTTTYISSSDALKNALQEAQRDALVATPSTASGSNTNAAITNTNTTTVTSMAPKKINWDLKRDISDKLEKLERRTQKAIVGILKERLELEAAKAVSEDGDSDGGNDDSDLD
mmetsp:Transcript_7438/g.15981  ORF Transcript_7438/g.15981 Transcript_7438/m.15981 type:complete len:231 (+) Transcript_7438:207-899(+)|eukprot:CAMPEP_0168177910 /NCGR_PEP_ID=MMETSP0139_2-20121125/8766_1 /TAXON_ID=44445 /ORGANISM="Pseudo-nitzschia australis, Strain 10249 10 AB" /LENGTH=230 /DNA_ID=CAMNT_0008097113 /DNA_START=187 /DNA_END=879 /DNA_ORIENTATION=-